MSDPAEPIKIDPDAIYDDATLVLRLGFTTSALSRERRAGRLRYSRRGGRTLYRGEWILQWLVREEADGQPSATARTSDKEVTHGN